MSEPDYGPATRNVGLDAVWSEANRVGRKCFHLQCVTALEYLVREDLQRSDGTIISEPDYGRATRHVGLGAPWSEANRVGGKVFLHTVFHRT